MTEFPTGRRRVRVVGIGSGGLDQITVEAARALRASDYALAAVKGPADPLVDLRARLLAKFADRTDHRVRQGGQACKKILELLAVEDVETVDADGRTTLRADVVGFPLDSFQVAPGELHVPACLRIGESGGPTDVGGRTQQ